MSTRDAQAVAQAVQYWKQSPQRYTGVRRLWVKVIIRAIYDYVLYYDRQDRIWRTADAWLFSEHPTDSLDYLCSQMGLDAEMIREFARTAKRRALGKLRLNERKSEELPDDDDNDEYS